MDMPFTRPPGLIAHPARRGDCDRMEWDEDAFIARVTARSKELGQAASTLLEKHGIDEGVLRKQRKHSRRIDMVFKIAAALEWSVADALGLDEPAAQVNPRRLDLAMRTAEKCYAEAHNIAPMVDRVGAISELAAAIYDNLTFRPGGEALSEEEAAAFIGRVLVRGKRSDPIPSGA